MSRGSERPGVSLHHVPLRTHGWLVLSSTEAKTIFGVVDGAISIHGGEYSEGEVGVAATLSVTHIDCEGGISTEQVKLNILF